MYGGVKKKWSTLSHHGVLFPPMYKKHNIPIIYNNEQIILPIDAEEYATIYSKLLETDYIKNKTFQKNFWNEWKLLLPKNSPIQSLNKIDFSLIRQYVLEQQLKPKQQINDDIYKHAIVDGIEQPVGNFRIEPPGIFIGRGCNPNMGRLKRRIYAKDIIINIGKEAPVPIPHPDNNYMGDQQWMDVIHDKTVMWLASYEDNVTLKRKYVWLGAVSEQKRKADLAKFELARKLKKKIKNIRKINNDNLMSENDKMMQIATAFYFIDEFSLRIGNEKGEDETDTVGVTSLRVEHIQLHENNKAELKFLGKDSIQYHKFVLLPDQVLLNIQKLIKGKHKKDQLFDLITANDVNRYLKEFMKDLTAKVFRTYNASEYFQQELLKLDKKYNDEPNKIEWLLMEYHKANALVAYLCNHQKTVSSSLHNQITRLQEQIKKLKKKPKSDKNKEKIKMLKAKLDLKKTVGNVSLTTSKINYIDPRITMTFIRKHNIPINKVFSKTLQNKFKWAETYDHFKF